MPSKLTQLGYGGNAILSSIMMAGIVAGAATVAYKNFNTTYSSTRVARIKSKQAIVEAQVRRRALQPDAYVECNSSNLATCRVNGDYFADLGNQKVVGSQCGGQNSVCGVAARNVRINPATRVFSAEVAYEGTDVKLKPLSVNLEIPVEVLQAPRFHCGEKDKSKPIFTGFDSAGAPVCEGFEACATGKFVKGVDVSKRKLICQDLPTRVACEPQKMITRLGWNGGSVDAACSEMPEPPFTSRLQTRQVASVDPNGQPTHNEGGGPGGDGGENPNGGNLGGANPVGNGNENPPGNAGQQPNDQNGACPNAPAGSCCIGPGSFFRWASEGNYPINIGKVKGGSYGDTGIDNGFTNPVPNGGVIYVEADHPCKVACSGGSFTAIGCY